MDDSALQIERSLAPPAPSAVPPALISLLHRLGGNGEAIVMLLAREPAAVDAVARFLAGTSETDILRKLTRTSTTPDSGGLEADFSYVGLPPEAAELSFADGFAQFVYPKLHRRADGFAAMFDALDKHHRPLILETGCLRVPNNWMGDGQSTFLFDWYARDHTGSVITIDINPESIESSRRACSSVTQTILNDSVAALHMLSERMTKPAALIYLDSFDLDINNPMPSAIHHAMELAAIRPLIGPGTLICVDDFDVAPLGPGGKGLIIDQFMQAIRAKVLYSGYQKVWQMPD